jgi:hypothetical protein
MKYVNVTLGNLSVSKGVSNFVLMVDSIAEMNSILTRKQIYWEIIHQPLQITLTTIFGNRLVMLIMVPIIEEGIFLISLMNYESKTLQRIVLYQKLRNIRI